MEPEQTIQMTWSETAQVSLDMLREGRVADWALREVCFGSEPLDCRDLKTFSNAVNYITAYSLDHLASDQYSGFGAGEAAGSGWERVTGVDRCYGYSPGTGSGAGLLHGSGIGHGSGSGHAADQGRGSGAGIGDGAGTRDGSGVSANWATMRSPVDD